MSICAAALVLSIVPQAVLEVAPDPRAPASRANTLEPNEREWPQWRGPRRDGAVAGVRWPASLLGSDALASPRVKLAWEVSGLGESYATPIVTERLVFSVGTVSKRDEVATAYDRHTGEKVWERRWAGSLSVPFFAAKNGSWVRSTPAYDGESLYIGGMRDVLVCLVATTGEERWRVDFVARHATQLPQFGLVCSPLIVGDALYLQAGASLAKLDKRTGETLWRTLDGQGGGMDSAFSSPILATLAGREQLVVQSRTHLSGVDPETGSVLWSRIVPAFRGMNILTPLVHGDAVFTSAYGSRGFLYDVRAGASGTSDAPSPSFTVSEAWTSRAQGYMTSPVRVDGHVYLFLRSNRFTCVDLATGEDTYISGPTGDDYWSLVTQSSRILALADTGKLRLIEANPEAYTVLSELDLVSGPSWAHLAVTSPTPTEGTWPAEGADLFVRSQTSLHAFHWR
jgi:outer membrane protein assembly factor BamB